MVKVKKLNSNGNVIEKKRRLNSKKIAAIMCACLMLFSFAACGSEEVEESQSVSGGSEEVEESQSVLGGSEEVEENQSVSGEADKNVSKDNNVNGKEGKYTQTDNGQENNSVLSKADFKNMTIGQIESIDGSEIVLVLAEMPQRRQKTENIDGEEKSGGIRLDELKFTGVTNNYVLTEDLFIEGNETEDLEKGMKVGLVLNENEEVVKAIVLQ